MKTPSLDLGKKDFEVKGKHVPLKKGNYLQNFREAAAATYAPQWVEKKGVEQ